MAAPEKLCWAPAATRHLVVQEGQSDLYPTAPPRHDETLTQEGDCVRGSVSLSVIELCHLGLHLHELCRRALPALDDRGFSAWRRVVAEHAVEPCTPPALSPSRSQHPILKGNKTGLFLIQDIFRLIGAILLLENSAHLAF